MRISNEGAGMIYRHPTNRDMYIRVMPGKHHSPYLYHKKPYVIQMKGGNAFDINGNFVSPKSPEAHIPIELFNYRK